MTETKTKLFNDDTFMAGMLALEPAIEIPVRGPYEKMPTAAASVTDAVLLELHTSQKISPDRPLYVVTGKPDEPASINIHVLVPSDPHGNAIYINSFDNSLKPQRYPGHPDPGNRYITPQQWAPGDEITGVLAMYTASAPTVA